MDREKIIKNLLIILLALLIILVFTKVDYVFKPIVSLIAMFIGPVIIAGFIYYWLRPITRSLTRGKLYKYKGLISILVIILFFSIFIFALSLSGSVLKDQFQDTIFNMTNNQVDYLSLIEENLAKYKIDINFYKYLEEGKDYLIKVLTNLPNMFSGIGNFTTQLILVPFILFYLLKEEDQIGSKILGIIPKAYKGQGAELARNLDGILSTYIVGQLLVALVIGVLMFIGYLIIKMPNALLMASFSIITAVIPMVGAFLGILPAILIALTIDLSLAIKVVVLSIVVQQLEGNLITPNLMGNRLNIHPFIIMIVVIVSINLLGLFGAFIGIPLYLVISILLKELVKFKRSKKRPSLDKL